MTKLREIPYIYKKLLNSFQSGEKVKLKDFRIQAARLRLNKKDSLEIVKELENSHTLEKKGPFWIKLNKKHFQNK